MDDYELMVLIAPTLKEQGAKKLTKEIQESLKDKKAKDIKEDFWGLRDLAYTIKKFNEGVYSVITFTADSQSVNSLSQELNLNDDIIRYMITNR